MLFLATLLAAACGTTDPDAAGEESQRQEQLAPRAAQAWSSAAGDEQLEPVASAAAAEPAFQCSPGADLTCNANADESWLSGRCLANGTCECALGNRKDAATGKCGTGPGDDEGYRTTALVAASRDDEGALVLLERTTSAPEQTRLSLQWIDRFGVAQGARVVLASQTGLALGPPTIATDGQRYVACWSEAAQVTCASIAPNASRATSVFEASGNSPALVYGSNTWVLAYNVGRAQEGTTQVLQLDGGFKPLQGPKTLPRAGGSFSYPLARLAARASGFVVVTGDPETVYPLDARLEASGPPVSLGRSLWGQTYVAATATSIAVSLAVPYGALLFRLDERGVIGTTHMSGGGKLGLTVQLRAIGSAIHASWHDTEWHDDTVDAGFKPLNTDIAAGQFLAVATLDVHGGRLAAISGNAGGARVVRIPAGNAGGAPPRESAK